MKAPKKYKKIKHDGIAKARPNTTPPSRKAAAALPPTPTTAPIIYRRFLLKRDKQQLVSPEKTGEFQVVVYN
jgi:hypothetical protein